MNVGGDTPACVMYRILTRLAIGTEARSKSTLLRKRLISPVPTRLRRSRATSSSVEKTLSRFRPVVAETNNTGAYDRNFKCRRTCSSRSEEHTSELQSLRHLVCRLLLEKKKQP